MLGSYVYKIQWLFNVRGNFMNPCKKTQKECRDMLKILGARSLDKIVFRKADMSIKFQYDDFIRYSSEEATKTSISYINKILRIDSEIQYVEFLKK